MEIPRWVFNSSRKNIIAPRIAIKGAAKLKAITCVNGIYCKLKYHNPIPSTAVTTLIVCNTGCLVFNKELIVVLFFKIIGNIIAVPIIF